VLLKLRENLEISIARSHRAQQNFRNLSTKASLSYAFTTTSQSTPTSPGGI